MEVGKGQDQDLLADLCQDHGLGYEGIIVGHIWGRLKHCVGKFHL